MAIAVKLNKNENLYSRTLMKRANLYRSRVVWYASPFQSNSVNSFPIDYMTVQSSCLQNVTEITPEEARRSIRNPANKIVLLYNVRPLFARNVIRQRQKKNPWLVINFTICSERMEVDPNGGERELRHKRTDQRKRWRYDLRVKTKLHRACLSLINH